MASDRIALNLKRFKLAANAEEEQRKRIKEDLAFQIPAEQWPTDVRAARGATTVGGVPIPARPMLSVAPVDEPIQLVSNQERAAHLAATFHPLSLDATDDTAEILQGLYDQGQNESNAGTARSWGYERVLWGGVGWYRLVAVFDPEGGHPSDQKIIWKRIKYQGNVYTDPFTEEADKSDRRWQFVIEDVPLEDYKQRYPQSQVASMSDSELSSTGSEAPGWIGGDDDAGRTVRIAEVWEVRIENPKVSLHSDGNAYAADETIPDGVMPVTGDGAWSGERETRTVLWSIMNCYEELEPEQEQDCEWIPLVYVCGRELQPFDGKERTVGMIANAKDAARLINYAASGAVEMAALEPKAPYTLDPRQIETFEPFWQQANTRNFPYLPTHRIIDGQVVEPPQRTQVDVSRLGPSMQILSMGGQMLQAAMSTFDPALGKQPTAHRSGVALEALQGQTEQAHSHYLDNLATISIPYEAKVWLSWAPKVYDRPGRIVRVRKGQGPKPKSDLVMLHKPFLKHPTSGRPIEVDPTVQGAALINLKGKFGISVTVGKSHASLLQEGNDALTAVVQAEPQLLSVIGPEWAMYQDRPGMKQVAEILKKDRDHRMPWLADQQGDPAQELAQTKQQLQALTQSAQAMQKQLETDTVKYQMQAQSDIAIKDLESKTQIQIQQMKDATQIEVARITAAKEAMIAEREAMEESIALNRKITADALEADKGRAHDVATHVLDHGSAVAQNQQTHEQAIAQSAHDNQNALEQADAQRQAAEAAQPSPQADGAGE